MVLKCSCIITPLKKPKSDVDFHFASDLRVRFVSGIIFLTFISLLVAELTSDHLESISFSDRIESSFYASLIFMWTELEAMSTCYGDVASKS